MHPFFLPVATGQRFCLHHPARGGAARRALLYLPPFGEEMNKSRRMAAVQARALAVAGCEVLQIDLCGCGDSSGDFGEASWQGWLDDVLAAHAWLRARSDAPLTLWGLRAGCLLAADAAPLLPEPLDFLFWQPVLSGKQYWQQVLRLKLAGELAGSAAAGASDWRRDLAAGRRIEIAGYAIAPGLVAGLAQTELRLAPDGVGRVGWLELSLREGATLSPAAQQRIEQLRAAGIRVDADVVPGPAFWQTVEVEEAPELIAASLAWLESLESGQEWGQQCGKECGQESRR